MATTLRPTTPRDLGFVTALEHWVIEHAGERAGYLIAYDTRGIDAGVYVKRILVGDKERGTGKAALAAFLDLACARPGVASELRGRAADAYRG